MINSEMLAQLLRFDNWEFFLKGFEEELDEVVYRDDFIELLSNWRIILRRWDVYRDNRGLYSKEEFDNIDKKVQVLDYLVDIKKSLYLKLLGDKL